MCALFCNGHLSVSIGDMYHVLRSEEIFKKISNCAFECHFSSPSPSPSPSSYPEIQARKKESHIQSAAC